MIGKVFRISPPLLYTATVGASATVYTPDVAGTVSFNDVMLLHKSFDKVKYMMTVGEHAFFHVPDTMNEEVAKKLLYQLESTSYVIVVDT